MPPTPSIISFLPCRVSPKTEEEPDGPQGRWRHQTIKPWLKPRSSTVQLWAWQTSSLLCPTQGAHTFPQAPHSLGRAPTPAAAPGHPQHPVEILAPASVLDGDKDKTTPPLINKGPDSAASIRQAIPEPPRPKPATKQLRAEIATSIRQPARGMGSGKHGSVPASPFTRGRHESRRHRRSNAKRRRLEETGSPPGVGIKDTGKRENKRLTPPVPHPHPCSRQRQTRASQHTCETQTPLRLQDG